MKFLIFFVFAVVLANTEPAVGARGRAYNAFNVRRGQFPSLVRLQQHFTLFGTKSCSGTLIRNDRVLTAAHCVSVFGMKPTQVRVFFGSEYRNSPHEQSVTVTSAEENVIVHPDYKTIKDDIALIKIPKIETSKEGGIGVALLPKKTNYVGKEVQIAGWGSIDDSGTEDRYAQWRTVKVYDNEHCPTSFESLSPKELCLYKAYVSSCLGDSGGPAYFDNEVVGVLSYIHRDGCETNKAMAYTNVAYFQEWIQKNID